MMVCKRIFFGLFLAHFLLIGSIDAVPSNATLMAWWNFEETSGTNIYDSSANGIDGNFGAGVTLDQVGKFGKAAYLDSAGPGWIDFGTNAISYLTGPISLVCWVNTTSAGWRMVLGSNSGNSDRGWELKMHEIFDFNTTQGTVNYPNVAPYRVHDGTWHLIAGVYDKANSRGYIYIDDTYSTNKSIGGGDISTGKSICIGSYRGQGDNYKGLLDDIAIFDGVLSSNEIATIYNQGMEVFMTPPSQGTALLFR